MALVALLSALALVASVALSPLFDGNAGRAERVVSASLLWASLILGPIYALGLVDRLTAPVLAYTSAATSVAALMGAWRARRGTFARGLLRDVLLLVRVPFDALCIVVRARSPLMLGVVATLVLLPWIAVTAYLAPTYKDWDALWYHEPIIGFTIQNHGFGVVSLPSSGLQLINGFQRLVELLGVWFGIFAGRRLIDLPNVLFLPLLAGSTCALVRRFTRDRALGVGWGAAIVLMPACVRLAQSTMVDPAAAAFLLAAWHLCTRPRLTLGSAWLGVFALALAAGAKTLSLFPCLVLTGIHLVRLVRRRREIGALPLALLIAGGGALVGGMVAFTHARNWIHFGNPLWPVKDLDIPRLGIYWRSVYAPSAPSTPIPALDMARRFVARPFSTFNDHSWQIADLGIGVVWVIAPLGFAASLAAPLVWLLRRVQIAMSATRMRRVEAAHATRAARATSAAQAGNAALIALPNAFFFYMVPAFYIGRYYIASVGTFVAMLTWMCRGRARKVSEGCAFLVQVTSIMMFVWAEPSWLSDGKMLAAMARTPFPLRELRTAFGAPAVEATAVAREAELRAGDVIGFEGLNFPALLWNVQYSNHAVYLDDPGDPLAQAVRLGAKWVYASGGSSLQQQLSVSSEWQLVGPLESDHSGYVYRRR